MTDFVQLWVYLSATPLFGLTATLVIYASAQTIYQQTGQAPLANPVLWSVVILASLLTISDTPYPTYFSGAQFIHFLLGPAVVALAWPMWERRMELRRRAVPLLAAALAGGFAAGGSVVAIAWALDLPADLIRSLAPKSVTAPVAMGICGAVAWYSGDGCRILRIDWSHRGDQRSLPFQFDGRTVSPRTRIFDWHCVAWHRCRACYASQCGCRRVCRPGTWHSGRIERDLDSTGSTFLLVARYRPPNQFRQQHRSRSHPDDLVDPLATKPKYESACHAAIVREHQQCASF